MAKILLIYPPAAKPSEPPAGIAKLAGALRGHNIECHAVDLNLEALDYILQRSWEADDTWSLRALRSVEKNRKALSNFKIRQNFDRYKRTVADLNRVLGIAGRDYNLELSLANYNDKQLSPLKSRDLLRAAEKPQENIYYPFFNRRLTALVESSAPSFIGFSLNYLSQALPTFAMVGFCRHNFPGVQIIIGGGLITSWSSRPNWKNPFSGLIDHLVSGPGAEKLITLMGGKPNRNRHFPPDYSDYAKLEYLAPGRTLPYAASSGCYWNRCSFCPEKAEGNSYSRIKPEIVVKELRQIVETQKERPFELIHFLDNALSPALLRTFAKTPPPADWYGFTRVENDLLDFNFCRDLRKSGCVMLKLGIESGVNRVLQSLDKGITIEKTAITLKNLRRAGIATYIYLLFGTPDETLEDARQTLDFTVQHQSEISFLNLAIFNLPLFSLESKRVEVSEFYAGDLSLYGNFIHPGGWQRREVRKFLDQEFKRHPKIAPIIKRDPPVFTSNHAPFFC